MLRDASSSHGHSLVEVLILLAFAMAVVASLAPTISSVTQTARITRATEDMTTIRNSIVNFTLDGFSRFTHDGSQDAAAQVDFLYSDGDIPSAGESSAWQESTASATHDFLEGHLVLNAFNSGGSYPTVGPSVWRGAYISAPVDPDPWGNRYAVNVVFLGASTDDVVVLSAGPDEAIDSPDAGNPLEAEGDDIAVLVEN